MRAEALISQSEITEDGRSALTHTHRTYSAAQRNGDQPTDPANLDGRTTLSDNPFITSATQYP